MGGWGGGGGGKGGGGGGICYVLDERGYFLRGKEPLLASFLFPCEGVFFKTEKTSFGFLFASLHCMTKPVQNEVPGEGGGIF